MMAEINRKVTFEQDGQMLFEHTMRKPQAFTAPVERFFVIRQEVWPFLSNVLSLWLAGP